TPDRAPGSAFEVDPGPQAGFADEVEAGLVVEGERLLGFLEVGFGVDPSLPEQQGLAVVALVGGPEEAVERGPGLVDRLRPARGVGIFRGRDFDQALAGDPEPGQPGSVQLGEVEVAGGEEPAEPFVADLPLVEPWC